MANWNTRYRRIIDAYRMKLMEVDPKACDEVDDRMWDMGEKWLVNKQPDLGRLMSAREIAESFGFTEQNIRDWARRHSDKVPTYKRDGRAFYCLRDVLKYWAGRKK